MHVAHPSTEWPREIDRLRRRFAAWRSRRDRVTRIPQSLWAAAVELARTHGVSPISRAVRVDYYALKKRLDAAGKASRSRDRSPAQSPVRAAGSGFVEIPVPVISGGSPPCVLEVQDRRGVRLRLELRGLDARDLSELVRSVWSKRR